MVLIPIYIFILLFTIAVDYIAGLLIEQVVGGKRKVLLIMSLVANIGVLAVFKYYNFFIDNIQELGSILHWNYSLPVLSVILPIGLSFHTFQAMSYTIEVFRGRQPAERHFGIYALYVLFFPQLVAGPIERPQNLLHQFREVHQLDWDRVAVGARLMLWGFFKKIVIADNLAGIVNYVFDYPTQFTGLPLIIAAVFFVIQLYCDFSGYSDIAIGAARVLGFRLIKNFDRPYISRSVSEFWRRWHISLSSWFRDYLYIPLGGNRVNWCRNKFNVFLVFLISGLWHGADWTFVVWGAIHGFYIIMSQITKSARTAACSFFHLDRLRGLSVIFSIITTFVLIAVSFIFFRARSISDAWYIITHLFFGFNFFEIKFSGMNILAQSIGTSMSAIIPILAAVIVMFFVEYRERLGEIGSSLISFPPWIRWTAYNVLLLWILFFGFFGEQPFIYFQF